MKIKKHRYDKEKIFNEYNIKKENVYVYDNKLKKYVDVIETLNKQDTLILIYSNYIRKLLK